ncbi:MAG TPA: CaiB/BaiF CoA-transferase family protein [Anaerolineales bacterium]|nr:CaiB/BaiF CoA-transferase family protein [Anaerolineales bacterium]
MSNLPLSSVRVLEFSHAVFGPSAGMLLADFGAEVIRIEPTPNGDPTRKLKGFGMGYYPFFNRNKKSVLLNLKDPQGLAVARRLLADSDVLIENFAPGTMERLGLGYDALKEPFPRLIYCSLKGFLPGPYEHRMALDEVVQMMSGLAYMTGPVGQPLRAGASVIDIMGGMYGAMGVLLALQEREKSGQGTLVRGALFETAAFVMGHHMAYSAVSGQPVPPMPARVSAWAIYHQFRTADDELIFVGVTSDQQWQRFCEGFQRPDLWQDARLSSNNGRIEQREWLLPDLHAMFARLTRAQALAVCEQAQLPFAAITRPEDLFSDPQLLAGNSLLDVQLPSGQSVQLPRTPILLGDEHWDLRNSPPSVGEHTESVLQQAGYTPAEIASLRASGAVG